MVCGIYLKPEAKFMKKHRLKMDKSFHFFIQLSSSMRYFTLPVV